MIEITWPGIVLVVLLGTLMGAGAAFFKARTLREMPKFWALGVGGFILGQVLSVYAPVHLFEIGVVHVEYGILVAALVFYLDDWWEHKGKHVRSPH